MGFNSTESIEEYVPTILFVDDEHSVLNSIGRFCRDKPWMTLFANSGAEGLTVLESGEIDIVVSDMRMPGMTGSDFLAKVRELYPETLLILMTGYSDIAALESTINRAKIYHCISKPWENESFNDVLNGALHDKCLKRNEKIELEKNEKKHLKLGKLALFLDKQTKEKSIETQQALTLLQGTSDVAQSNYAGLIRSLEDLVFWGEKKLGGYSGFVSEYSTKVAEAIGLSDHDINTTRIAGLFHNIGLLALPDEICKKEMFRMSKQELELYQTHCLMAESLLNNIPSLCAVAKVIRSHHEYVNGSGFPDKLIHTEIPMPSRIICAVTDYYRIVNGMLIEMVSGDELARHILLDQSGKRYDAKVVKIFLDLLGELPDKIDEEVISTALLKPQMVLKNEVLTPQGVKLLAKGTRLNKSTINNLKRFEEQSNTEFKIYAVKPK